MNSVFFYRKNTFFHQNHIKRLAPIALWATHRHTPLLRYRRPKFESDSRTFPDPAPYLSPTLLPVSSDLSYSNKGKHAKNKSKKHIQHSHTPKVNAV